MQRVLIESDEALAQIFSRDTSPGAVMVDTEFMRRNTFYPEVGLLQLCFASDPPESETAWLVDPTKISDVSPLVDCFADTSVLKVLHSASEDLEVFQRWLGQLPVPLFDSQRAAALLGMGFGLGYRALVQEICDVDLPKGETRSNWLQRPLTESQCEYAAQDVTWLLRVWRELHRRCEQAGRLEWVLSDGNNALASLSLSDSEPHEKIKSAWKLNPRQLATLAAVCRWREKTAKQRNKPRAWIIDDQTCLQVALSPAISPQELSSIDGLPAGVIKHHGIELLDLMEEQRSLPETALPEPLPSPLSGEQRGRMKELKSRVRDEAQRLGVEPEILASKRDYELLLREAAGVAIRAPQHWSGWRQDLVVTPLREFLAGTVA